MKQISLLGVGVAVVAGCTMIANQAHAWALVAFVVANGFAILANNGQRLLR